MVGYHRAHVIYIMGIPEETKVKKEYFEKNNGNIYK
jgi:hypothetical protein